MIASNASIFRLLSGKEVYQSLAWEFLLSQILSFSAYLRAKHFVIKYFAEGCLSNYSRMCWFKESLHNCALNLEDLRERFLNVLLQFRTTNQESSYLQNAIRFRCNNKVSELIKNEAISLTLNSKYIFLPITGTDEHQSLRTRLSEEKISGILSVCR